MNGFLYKFYPEEMIRFFEALYLSLKLLRTLQQIFR
jgi:hypothetical protein